jgi:hypothetical protein
VVAAPEVFVLVFAVAEPEVFVLVFAVVEPEVFVLVFAVAELSSEVVVLAVEPAVVVLAVELEVVFVVDFEVSELEVVSVAVVSVADVAELQPSVDILVAFVVSLPASVVAVGVDSPGPPRFHAFPSGDCHASSSSSVEVVGKESVRRSTGVRTNDGLCSILSNLGLHQNKNVEHCHNKPSPGHNNASDTNDLPIDATTSHSRRTSLHLYQGQRRHTSQVSLPPRVVREIE